MHGEKSGQSACKCTSCHSFQNVTICHAPRQTDTSAPGNWCSTSDKMQLCTRRRNLRPTVRFLQTSGSCSTSLTHFLILHTSKTQTIYYAPCLKMSQWDGEMIYIWWLLIRNIFNKGKYLLRSIALTRHLRSRHAPDALGNRAGIV